MKALSLNKPVEMTLSSGNSKSIAAWVRGGLNRKCLWGLLGVAILLAGWQILSMMLSEMIIASPLATLSTFVSLLSEKATWLNILITSQRLVIGLLIGSVMGIALGLSAGLNNRVKMVLEPLRWVAMTVPAVVIAIVAMLWFGMGSTQVILVAAIINTPFTYVNIREGLLAIDERIVEMGRSFRLPRRMFFTDIYLPSIGSSLMAALTLTAGMGVRVIVLSELMGAHEGIGHSFSVAWTRLDTPGIFAWILMSLLLLGVLEFGVLSPMKNRIMRWKTIND
jgi:NitT/TauT family transport system permease protein